VQEEGQRASFFSENGGRKKGGGAVRIATLRQFNPDRRAEGILERHKKVVSGPINKPRKTGARPRKPIALT